MSEVEWINIFGDNLASMLEDARMTQKELAEEVGVAESTISRFINKQTAPSIFTIVNLSYALDCDISELVDFGDRIEL